MAMKFGKVANNNETSPAQGTSAIQMGIENAPAKLIVKYITDMYARPLSAAIRETVSNALDAATAAGKGAGDVHVSYDTSSSVFSVRDNGAGMDYDKLVNVYTQYGVSDKRDDGISTGAFGLGAKSPLAYTNEFSVLTRTEKDGCLFLRAYRTPDDDFVADLPVSVPQGGSVCVTVYKDAFSERSVAPPADSEAALLESDSDIYAEELIVENPFGDSETGTIVSFKTYRDWSTQSDVNRTIEMMSSLLHYTGDGDIVDAVDKHGDAVFAEQDFYCFGQKMITDDAGDELPMRVFACHTLSGTCSDYRLRSFSNLFCDKPIDADNIMFKVGNWLYPVNGTMYSTGSPTPAYIIDVPSKALSFVPSRDAILAGKNDNVAELIACAQELVSAHMSEPGAKEAFLNWAVSLSGTFTSAVDALLSDAYMLDTLVDGKIVVRYSPDDISNYESYTLDPSVIMGAGGCTLRDLVNTPYCVTGLIDSPKSALRNAGLYAVSDCDAAKLCSNVVHIMNSNMIRLHALPGYALAKSKTVADDVYGATGDTAVHKDGIVFASTQVNHASHRASNLSTAPTLDYPVGLAMMNLVFSSGSFRNPSASHVVFIDGSVQGIKKARTGVLNIAKNLQIQASEVKGTPVPPSYFYIILPPKSPTSNWTVKEKKDIESFISAIVAASGRGYTYVPDADIAALSKKPESAKKMESSELEKMVSNARVVQHVVKLDDNGMVLEDKLDGTMYTRYDKKDIAKHMLDDPCSWGIVVVDQKEATIENAWCLARSLYSFDLVPEYIDSIVCISDKNFSKKRADMCVESGFLILYDQSKKTGEGFLPASTASFDEKGDVELHIPPTPTSRLVTDCDESSSKNRRFLEIINAELSGRSWSLDGKDAYNPRWVEGFTCGHEKVDLEDNLADLDDIPYWKLQGIRTTKLDEKYVSAEEKERAEELDRVCMRLKQCVGIWAYCLSSMALSLDLNQVSDKVISNLPQLAAITGVESCIDSLYAGVPYDDIVA